MSKPESTIEERVEQMLLSNPHRRLRDQIVDLVRAERKLQRERDAEIATEWGWSNKPDHAIGIALAILAQEEGAV